ncbi:MAG: MFS transporter [Chitinophagales bacterium]
MKVENKWLVLFTVSVGIFMSTLDSSILNIANPTIARDLGVGINQVQLVATSYITSITALLLLFGKLGDRLGGHKIYSVGFLIFAAGSLLSSFAVSLTLLVSFRIIQAIGAAMMMSTGNGIVSNVFPINERGRALGITATVVAIGTLTGPSIGGFLVSAFGWPSIFLVNVPVGIAGFLLSVKVLPAFPGERPTGPFDYPGFLLVFIALPAFIASLSGSEVRLWLLAISLGLIVLFILKEMRALDPLMDLSLFRIPTLSLGSAASSTAYICYMFVTFLLPFFLERVWTQSPAVSGLLMTVIPFSTGIIAPFAGYLSDKIGSWLLSSAGMLIMTAGLGILSFLPGSMSYTVLLFGMIGVGLGMGLFNSPNSSSIYTACPQQKAGIVGSFLAVVRNISMATGVALSVIFLSLGSSHTVQSADAFMSGFSLAMRAAALIGFSGAVLTMVKGWEDIRKQSQPSETDPG